MTSRVQTVYEEKTDLDKILEIIGLAPTVQKNDSLTDRLSYKYTALLFCSFSILVTAKQYVGEPISCWVPAHFSENWEEYTNSYCWIKNTYYLPFGKYIPKEHDKRDMITYYQWVPIILIVQAFLFYLPCMVWDTFNVRSGVDINNIVQTCKTYQKYEKANEKNNVLDHLTKQIYRYVDSQGKYKTAMSFSIKNLITKLSCSVCGRQKGNYLVTLYLFVKVLYISNILAQFFLMNEFLGTSFHEYGVKFFRMLYYKDDEEIEIPAFPRVTMCDFKIRVVGSVQQYTVQCVLPINLFNEMIYLFMWWWMVILGIASVFSFFAWFWRIVSADDRSRFIRKHLMLLNRIRPREVDQNTDENFLKVVFSECSDKFPPLKTEEPGVEASDQDPKIKLTKVMNQKQQCEIFLNPEKHRKLLWDILQVTPEEARRKFEIEGDKGGAFVNKFIDLLHQDGIFVLRIVGNNTNSITITEVICALWDTHCERDYIKQLKMQFGTKCDKE